MANGKESIFGRVDKNVKSDFNSVPGNNVEEKITNLISSYKTIVDVCGDDPVGISAEVKTIMRAVNTINTNVETIIDRCNTYVDDVFDDFSGRLCIMEERAHDLDGVAIYNNELLDELTKYQKSMEKMKEVIRKKSEELDNQRKEYNELLKKYSELQEKHIRLGELYKTASE